MDNIDHDQIRKVVRENYAKVAQGVTKAVVAPLIVLSNYQWPKALAVVARKIWQKNVRFRTPLAWDILLKICQTFQMALTWGSVAVTHRQSRH